MFIGPLIVAQVPRPTIVQAARRQVGVTVTYDPAYRRLAYPGGDVPPDRGVCTDVVIRALRTSRRIDLQKLVYQDMSRHFGQYPRTWGQTKPDRNIDHRRVPNLEVFFARKGWQLSPRQETQPGDIIAVRLPSNRPHIMVVSDRKTPTGRYLVIHNIGYGAQEEDQLSAYKVTGRFRVK